MDPVPSCLHKNLWPCSELSLLLGAVVVRKTKAIECSSKLISSACLKYTTHNYLSSRGENFCLLIMQNVC